MLNGDSGINVLCGRRERRSGGGLTPKKGIENRERTTIASRLVRSPCTMARSVQTSYGDGEGSATAAVRRQSTIALHDSESGMNVLCGRREHSGGGGPTPKRASRTTSARRSRLDLNDRPARWRERYKRPMGTARAPEHSDGGGPTPKKGIDHREPSAHNERVSTCTITLHDGESGTIVLCGRREHSGTVAPTPKNGIENHERTTTSASRLERSRLAQW